MATVGEGDPGICVHKTFVATYTREAWPRWFRWAARGKLCTAHPCPWCPRTRYGARSDRLRAMGGRSPSSGSAEGE